MKSGFADPTAIKKQHPKDNPQGPGKEWPWNYECPQYDERSSCFVNAGTHYGVGHKSPVGHEGNPKQRVKTMPFGKPKTMQVDESG
jgi:hypothetical protein